MSSPASRTVISVSAEVPMMEERLNSMEAKLAKLDQLETAGGRDQSHAKSVVALS